jgi:hypothetical protein
MCICLARLATRTWADASIILCISLARDAQIFATWNEVLFKGSPAGILTYSTLDHVQHRTPQHSTHMYSIPRTLLYVILYYMLYHYETLGNRSLSPIIHDQECPPTTQTAQHGSGGKHPDFTPR